MKGLLKLEYINITLGLHRCAHSWDIKLNTRRETRYLQTAICYSVNYINILYYWRLFWQFSEDFRTLCEDFRRFSKSCPMARQSFPRNIFRGFPRKNRACFDHTGTHLTITVVIFSLKKTCYFHLWITCPCYFTSEDLTNWRQFSCVCPLIDHEFRDNVVKVAVNSVKLSALACCRIA